MADGKVPPSGLEETIAADTGDTLPASDPEPAEPALRSSRASIPPVPTDRYRHGDELGRGGMGRVVEAYDTQLGRTVAVKEVLPRGTSVARRFVREIEITARLEHHGIVPLYDSGTTPDGRPFYVMRRVSGRPLDEEIRRKKNLDERLTLLPAMLAAIDAIAHAHKRSVIHRDLKPTNILVGELGETVVIDWGLAKVVGEEHADSADDEIVPLIPQAADSLQTQAGSVFGTPGFMAPEQARGEDLSPSTDVYALGATMYQLLAGKPPVGGDSADEVIVKTLKHDVPPLDEVVDGVPPELIAIVDKALAFDAAVRYRNAGELAEDLRRFLDGRLVAAHQYTRRQRLARFVRKHRGILGVIALALVAVAVLAWFSVSRIVEERDAAREARRQAVHEKLLAEQARDRLAERTDALLITQARSLLDRNPTHAIASLADIPATSKRSAEARAVAQAAVVRGTWWAMQGPDVLTLFADISPDGAQLVQVTRDGVVRVWDLDRQRLVIARPYKAGANARWVRDRKLVVFNLAGPPELLDPAANTSTPLGAEEVDVASTSATGDHVLVTDKAKAAWLIALATGERTAVWPGHAIQEAVLAPDGSWLAVSDKASVVALDLAGTELARRALTDQHRLVVSAKRQLAVIAYDKAWEVTLGAAPVWIEIPISVPGQTRRILDAIYRGDTLEMMTLSGEVYAWSRQRLAARGIKLDAITYSLRVAGDAVVTTSEQSKLTLVTPTVRIALFTPQAIPHARTVGREGVPRLIVVGDGIITGVELATVLPRRLTTVPGARAAFTDDDLIFSHRNLNELAWIDIADGTRTPLATAPDATYDVMSFDPSSGRVFVRETSARGRRLLVAAKRATALTEIAVGPAPWGILLRGDALLFGTGETQADGKILAQVGGAAPREIVKVNGEVVSAVPVAPLEFAALGGKGELVRANVSTGAVQRASIATGSSMFVASDLDKRVAVVVDNRLSVWTQDIVEVARFDKRIREVAPLQDGTAIVVLDDSDTYRVTLAPGARPVRIVGPGQAGPAIDSNGTLLVSFGHGLQLEVLDLVGNVRWTLPAMNSGRPSVAVSPRGRAIVQDTMDGLVAWTLPMPDADLAAWISEQTSARIVGDVLTWPWQKR